MGQEDKRPLKAKLLGFRKQQKKQSSSLAKEEKLLQNQQSTSTTTSYSSTPTNTWPKSTNANESQNWQQKVPEKQNEYPKRDWNETHTQGSNQTEQPNGPVPQITPIALEAPPWRCILDNFFTVDLLNNYPMRKWREFCAEKPLQCWLLTGIAWAIGQFLAAKAQFGFVFFIIFLLLLLLLNLGVRKEGELSAYSVFNPNYERLLGELTGEDFEQEILMRRKREAQN